MRPRSKHALAVPPAYVPVGTGAFLGALACLVFRLVRPAWGAAPPAPTRAASDLPSTVSGVLPHSAIALAVAVVLAGVPARAADVEGKLPKEAAPSAPYPVFIPTDERQRPTGGKLPEKLPEALEAARSEIEKLLGA